MGQRDSARTVVGAYLTLRYWRNAFRITDEVVSSSRAARSERSGLVKVGPGRKSRSEFPAPAMTSRDLRERSKVFNRCSTRAVVGPALSDHGRPKWLA